MPTEADQIGGRLRAEFPRPLRDRQGVGRAQPAGAVVARWEAPGLGPLEPSSFIELAEELGLMTELSLEMLRQALVQHKAWAAAGRLVPVSVNIGPDCVADPDFPAAVYRLLGEEQVPGRMVALELSEETG